VYVELNESWVQIEDFDSELFVFKPTVAKVLKKPKVVWKPWVGWLSSSVSS